MVSKLDRFIKKFSTQLYIGWVLFIALVTLIPGYSIPGNINWNILELDKIIHMTIFGILAYLGGVFYLAKTKLITRSFLLSLAPAILYGTLIELGQTLIPQRGFDYADLTANSIGALIGVLIFYKQVKKKTAEF